MLDRLRPSMEEFVHDALDQAGAVWETGPDGVTSVLWESEASLRRITLEPEIAREDSGVDLVASGSPVFDSLARFGLGRGRVARAHVAPPPRSPPALGRAYQFTAEKVMRTEWRDRVEATWLFAFAATHAGEYRRESLHFCAVDAATLRVVRRLHDALSRLTPHDAGPEPEGDRPFAEVYAVARAEVLGSALTVFRAAQRQANDEAQRETSRLDAYYDAMLDEARDDLARAGADGSRHDAIAARIVAIEADRARSLSQVREQGRLAFDLEAAGALAIIYPRGVSTVTLHDKKGPRAQTTVVWDPILEQFEALVCPACGRPTYALELRGTTPSCGCA
ncbi:MAG: hypothetical protein HY719_15755 [Planctomycetes bacterium]|nr:hypothetical protein [Planctomycetota bacterium]